MKNLSYQILSVRMRKITHPHAKIRNETRCSSTFEMLQRYCHIKDHLGGIDQSKIQDLLPTDEEDGEIECFLPTLKDFKSVTNKLQASNLYFGGAWILFDVVLEKHPSTRPELSPRSNLIENAAFESALCKVQNGHEKQLTAAEGKSLHHLLLSSASKCTEAPDNNKPFAAHLLKRRRLSSKTGSMRYMDLRFLLLTSIMCERLFSIAKFSMGRHRAGSLSSNIECQLFLNINASVECG